MCLCLVVGVGPLDCRRCLSFVFVGSVDSVDDDEDDVALSSDGF